MSEANRPNNVVLRPDNRAVVILDQSRLPGHEEYLALNTLDEMVEAIRSLRVRGAPAIGIFAACGLAVLANALQTDVYADFLSHCRNAAEALVASRPTAVNLSWAVRRVLALAEAADPVQPVEVLKQRLLAEARRIQDEDIAMCHAIARHGLGLIQSGDGVLTHCNAGPLATSLYGTALGPILLAREQGWHLRVFADETRPLLQGARLTTYELQRADVDVTLICDNMASTVMKNGWINACFVGCDRVAANGDVANKIGTSGVAILARHYGIPFYVLGPTSTIDLSCQSGDDIVIEQRDPDEIRSKWYTEPMAPAGVKCYNPAFDVTANDLIAGIVTEKGVCRAPYPQSLAALF